MTVYYLTSANVGLGDTVPILAGTPGGSINVAAAAIPSVGVTVTDGTNTVANTTSLTLADGFTVSGSAGAATATFNGPIGTGTATATAGAATVNEGSGIVTSQALVSATSFALTLTNSLIKTTSVIQLTLSNSAGLATWPVTIVCSNGSAVITVAMASLTGTVVVAFSVFN